MMSMAQYIGKKLGGKLIQNADDFSEAFLDNQMVAVVACTGFGCPKYVRWSYATAMDNIREGVDRLEKFLATVEE